MNEFITPELVNRFTRVYDLLSKAGDSPTYSDVERELIRRVFFYQIYTPEIHTPVWAANNGRLFALQCIWRMNAVRFTPQVVYKCATGAVTHGHVHILQWFAEQGECNFPNALWTLAAKERQLGVLRYLATINMDSAFTEACRFAHMDIVHELLAKGVNPRANEDNALCWAAYGKRLKVVKFLVEEHGANVRAQNDDCIRFACGSGYLELVQYLVDRGADFRANNDEPFEGAVRGQHVQVVAYLLKVSPELAEIYKGQLLNLFNNGNRDMMRALLPALDSKRVVIIACTMGRLRLLRFIASMWCLEVSDEAMLAAAERGHLDMLRYLVAHGGNPRACNDAPMFKSAAAGRLNMVRYLASQGAPLEAVWRQVVNSQNKYLIKYLVEKSRVEVNTVLNYAASHGLVKVVQEFLRFSTGHNRPEVLFDKACYGGHVNVVEYLLSGVLCVTVNMGFISAVRGNQLNVVKYLVARFGKECFAEMVREYPVWEEHLSGSMLRYLNTIRKSCK